MSNNRHYVLIISRYTDYEWIYIIDIIRVNMDVIRCFLCMKVLSYIDKVFISEYLHPCEDIFTGFIGDSRTGGTHYGIFCSKLHADIYRREIEYRDNTMNIKYCRNCGKSENIDIKCNCGSKHYYCNEICMNDYHTRKVGKLCTNCKCSEIYESARCYYKHKRCLKCKLRNRCRICEATPWCPYFYNLFFRLGRTRKEEENKINYSFDIKCNKCNSEDKLVLIQPCMKIYCLECIKNNNELYSCFHSFRGINHTFSFIFSTYWN